MSDTPVHRAGPDEAPEVAALLHAFNTEYDEPSPGVEVLTDRLTAMLAGAHTIALLAGAPGRPADGVALLSLRPNVWCGGPLVLLDELYVVPAHRNHGLGTALLTHTIDTARAEGASVVEINVDGEDTDARRFYERHGFGCTHGDPPQPELLYSREL